MSGTEAETLRAERARLIDVLRRVAEKEARVTWIGGRPVLSGHPTYAEIEASIAAYPIRHAEMLRARPCTGESPIAVLDVVVASDFGRGHKPQVRGAAKRLRVLVRIARVLCGLGDGLRFGELIAATGLGEQRLWYMLQWAKRQNALREVDGCWYADHTHRRLTRSVDKWL